MYFILKRIFLHKFSLFFFQYSQQGVLRTYSRICVFFSKQVLLKTFLSPLINHRYTQLEGCCLFIPFLYIFDNYLFLYKITTTVRDQ